MTDTQLELDIDAPKLNVAYEAYANCTEEQARKLFFSKHGARPERVFWKAHIVLAGPVVQPVDRA